jgi:hypothetical protein
MNVGFDLIAANLGFSFTTIIMIIVSLGGMIVYAKDIKVGMLLHAFAFLLLFIWFKYNNWDFQAPLIAFFVMIVLLSLSLLLNAKSASSPGGGMV